MGLPTARHRRPLGGDPSLCGEVEIQIVPIGIGGFDQVDFPIAFPALETFLPLNCVGDVLMFFIPDEVIGVVSAYETFRIGTVFMQTRQKVGRDADVKCAKFAIDEDVNETRH